MADSDPRACDELLDEAVVTYLEALETGTVPDPQEWLSRDPQLAAERAEFCPDQNKVKRGTAPLREAALQVPTASEDPNAHVGSCPFPLPPTTLGLFGDYELLEQIARGGMGVVYRARQLRLN